MSKLAITFILTIFLAIYVFTQSNSIDGEVDELVQDNHIFEEQDLDQLEDVVGSITPEKTGENCFDEEKQETLSCALLINNIKTKIDTHSPRSVELIIKYRNQIVDIKKSKDIKIKDKELLLIEELSAIELEQIHTKYFMSLDSDDKAMLIEKHGGVEYLQYFYATNLLPPEKMEIYSDQEHTMSDFDDMPIDSEYQNGNNYAEYEEVPSDIGFQEDNQDYIDMTSEDNYRDLASDVDQIQDNGFIQEVESDYIEEEIVQEDYRPDYQEQEGEMTQDYQQEDYDE